MAVAAMLAAADVDAAIAACQGKTTCDRPSQIAVYNIEGKTV